MIQLLLSLPTPRTFTHDNLVIHEGIETAASSIQSVYGSGPSPMPSLFLYGPPGTGKTHLLRMAAGLLETRDRRVLKHVPFISPSESEDAFSYLRALVSDPEAISADICGIAVDDVHVLSHEGAADLWTLSNRVIRSGIPLMLASTQSPDEVFLGNPHLISRLLSGLVFALGVPPDGVRLRIMDKLARDRQVRLSQDVCQYLITRKARNVKELERILDILDTASLRHKRPITIPFIKALERDRTL